MCALFAFWTLGGQRTFGRNQVGDRDEIAQCAVATRFSIDALDNAVGDFGIEPSQNAAVVSLDGARDYLDRLEARSDSPAVPAIAES
jgi:hypothetical protein